MNQALIDFGKWLDVLDIPSFPSESEIELLTAQAALESDVAPQQPIDMLPENGSAIDFLI